MPPVRGEIEILEEIRRRAALPRGAGVVLGIGDDCAIYRSRGSREDLLFTTDLLLEDIHFRHDTPPPEAVGHKALARGLSDIAAMGGVPRFCLLSLAMGERAGQSWMERFYDGRARPWQAAIWRAPTRQRATSWCAGECRGAARCGGTAPKRATQSMSRDG